MAATATSTAATENWSDDAAWAISGIGTASAADGVLASGVLTPTVSPAWTVSALVGRRIKLDATWYSISANSATAATITAPPADATYAYLLGGAPIAGDACIIADGTVMTLDTNTSIASLTAAGNTGYILCATDRTITLTGTGITYAGTLTAGFIRHSANTLTILGAGAGTTTVTGTAAGYAVVTSGTGALTITNTGGTAAYESGNGRCVSHGSTGNLTITGILSASSGSTSCQTVNINGAATVQITGNILSAAYAITVYVSAAAVVATITGDVTATGGNAIYLNSAAATVTLDGNINATGVGVSFAVNGGTFSWTGNRTIATSAESYATLSAGTLNLVLQSGAYTPLVLSNSGTFILRKTGGTLNTTGNGGASVASIVRQSATSYAAMSGCTDAQKAIITGPTLPAAANVRLSGSATYGYAGALFDGTISMPNSGTPTGTEDATSDACVVLNKNYGAANARTGSAAGGSAVYMPTAKQIGL
jgi:hypothetical protein